MPGATSSSTNVHVTSGVPSTASQPSVNTRSCSIASSVNPSVAAGQRRENSADGRMLQVRHDARRARLPAVVEPVVAVPAATAARSHLHQPGPHVMRCAANRHAVRQRVDGLRNPLVSGQCACAFICGGADRAPEPPGTERDDRHAFGAPANRPQQLPGDKRAHRFDQRQYRANLRSASGDSARVACSRTSQCSPGRPVGATRTLMNSFSWSGSSNASNASRLANRCCA